MNSPEEITDAYLLVCEEMRGQARAANHYYRTLLTGPFTRDEAFELVRDWHRIHWQQVVAASLADS